MGTIKRRPSIKAEIAFCVRGVVSPLLSNLMLDVLDKELERRGHRFARYADDCAIYVGARARGRAGDGERRTVPRTAAEAQGQQSQERGRAAVASQVPRVQLHRRRDAEASHRSAGSDPAQGTRARGDEADAGRARASQGSSKTCRAISWDGAATSASARRLRCSARSTSGSGAGFDPSSGSNGSAGRPAMRSCAAGAWAAIWRPKPPEAPTAPWRISNSPALTIALPNDLFRKTLGLASVAAAHAA